MAAEAKRYAVLLICGRGLPAEALRVESSGRESESRRHPVEGPVLIQIQTGDRQLLGSIAAALAEAARRSGEWLVCRPGCHECCLGAFPISALDALRLREGLAALERVDRARAAAIRARAEAYQESSDDVACPALDPETGHCGLYESRPIACRAFGPATRIGEGAVGACELCYAGADDEEIARCAVEIDPDGLEEKLVAALEAEGISGTTIVAHALLRS